MKNREAIERLKRAGLRNSLIAEILDVSKQYVSRIVRTSGLDGPRVERPRNDGLLGARGASLLLGVPVGTVRRWCDQGKIPCSRANGVRRDRIFEPTDLLGSMARKTRE